MKTYAFIFARGGSKGLKGKNIKKLCDKPLLAHSIDIAKSIDEISKVFVSTEDEDIQKVAIEYGANVIIRPKVLATDTSPEIDSWKHAINYLTDLGDSFDRFISLPTTSPLRSKDDVERAMDSLAESSDIVVTVSESHRNPFFNLMKFNGDGYLETFSKDKLVQRRQDAPKCYDLTTVAYVTRPEYILKNSNMFDGNVSAVNVPFERAIDIDTEVDFYIAEALMKRKIDVEK